MLLTSICYLLRTVALGDHNHGAAGGLERIYIRVHALSGCWAHRTTRHTFRSLCRTCIIYRVVLEVFRQACARCEAFVQFGVSNVACYDNGTVEAYTGRNRIFGQFLANISNRLVEVDLDSIPFTCLTQGFRNQFVRFVVHLFNPETFLVDLGFDVTVGRTTNAHTYRARTSVAWQAYYADVMADVLASELSAQTDAVSFFGEDVFQFDVTECTTCFITGSRQIVVEVSGSQLNGQQVTFYAGAAHYKCNVIRRTSGSTERLDLFHTERNQLLWIQQSFGFLVKVSLVGRTTPFSDEQELVFVTLCGFDVNLCRKVATGVYLIVHGERSVLRITQVLLGIYIIDAARKGFFIAEVCPYTLSFFTVDNGCSCILADRKLALASYFGIAQHGKCHILVIIRRFGVVQNLGHLCIVGTAHVERYIVECLLGELGECFLRNHQDFLAVKFGYRYSFFGEEIIFGFVFARLEHWGILEFGSCCHIKYVF